MCTEYMRPPIILCANGNNICNTCKPKMDNSPTCREQFLDTRNKCAEDLVRQMKYPCKYGANGCTDIFNRDTIVGHQVKCRYSLQLFPVVKLEIGKCSWSGSYSDIKGHLKVNHLDNCCEYFKSGNKFPCRSTALK
jgi:hypothetical protein